MPGRHPQIRAGVLARNRGASHMTRARQTTAATGVAKPARGARRPRSEDVIHLRHNADQSAPSLGARLRSDVSELLTTLEAAQATLDAVQEQNNLIRQIDRTILESTYSADKVLEEIIAKGRKHTGASNGQIILVQRNRLIVRASSAPGRVSQEIPSENSLCAMALREDSDLHCPDLSRLQPHQYVRFHDATKSELVLLIRPELGSRVFGILSLEREVGPFSEEAIEFASLLAGQAALAIAQARIWQSVDLLHRISTGVLIGELTLDEAYSKILYSALDILNFEYGQVLRADGDELMIISSSRQEDIGLRVLHESSICGRYLITERGRLIKRIDDVQAGEYAQYYLALLKAPAARPMRSEMIVPLVMDKRLVGALNIESPRRASFTEFDEKVLDVLAKLMVLALSATFSRRAAQHQDRIEAANLAMTHLGHVAQAFLHQFNGMIGHVRGNLVHLRKRVNEVDAIARIEIKKGVRVPDFLRNLEDKLKDGANIVHQFSQRFHPDHPRFRLKQMNLAKVARRAVGKLRDEQLPLINVEFAMQSPAGASSDKLATLAARTDCILSEFIYDVVGNILNNAVDTIRERQRHEPCEGLIRVLVSLPDPFLAQLTISDNGMGIPPEFQKRVFEFNFSTKKRKQPTGGIGLWFCELYMLQRGGKITFCPNPIDGQGTVFELQFPTILANNTT